MIYKLLVFGSKASKHGVTKAIDFGVQFSYIAHSNSIVNVQVVGFFLFIFLYIIFIAEKISVYAKDY